MPRPDYTWNEKRQCWEKNVRKADGKYTKIRTYGRGSLSELRKLVRDFEIEQERLIETKTGESFSAVAERWYSFVSVGIRENTAKNIRYHLDKRILPVIGDIEITKLKPADIDEIIVRMSEKKISSARKALSIVKRIIAYAQENGMDVMTIPSTKKAVGTVANQREALTRDQQEQLLSAVKGRVSEMFVYLCLFAGLRESEACGLLWEDVHLDGDYPYISVCHSIDNDKNITTIMKTEAANRTIPIPEILVTKLREQKRLAGTVISTRKGSPVTGRSASAMLMNIEKVQNLGFHVYPHLLRHTYISELCAASAETGLDIKTIQTLAGHASPQITMKIYAHVMQDRQADTAKKVQKIFSGR